MKVYVRSLWVGLLIFFSMTTWAKDTTTATASTSFNGPMIKVVPQSESGVYHVSFLSPESVNLTIKVMDDDGKELYQERLRNVRQFSKKFRLASPKEGAYTFLVAGKGWRIKENVQYVRQIETPLKASLLTVQDPKRVLLHVSGAESDEVFVSISDAYGTLLFEEYVQLDKEGYRCFNLNHMQSGRFSFTVYDNQLSAEEMIMLR
ncbi:MAG: hypothetical protein AAF587_23350 [Bacteroidota bacterium]